MIQHWLPQRGFYKMISLLILHNNPKKKKQTFKNYVAMDFFAMYLALSLIINIILHCPLIQQILCTYRNPFFISNKIEHALVQSFSQLQGMPTYLPRNPFNLYCKHDSFMYWKSFKMFLVIKLNQPLSK